MFYHIAAWFSIVAGAGSLFMLGMVDFEEAFIFLFISSCFFSAAFANIAVDIADRRQLASAAYLQARRLRVFAVAVGPTSCMAKKQPRLVKQRAEPCGYEERRFKQKAEYAKLQTALIEQTPPRHVRSSLACQCSVKARPDKLSALRIRNADLQVKNAKLRTKHRELRRASKELLEDCEAALEEASSVDITMRGLVSRILAELRDARREVELMKEAHEKEIRELHSDWMKDHRNHARQVEQLRLGRAASLVEQEISTDLEDAMFKRLWASKAKESLLVDKLSAAERALAAQSSEPSPHASPALSDMSFTSVYGGIVWSQTDVPSVPLPSKMPSASLDGGVDGSGSDRGSVDRVSTANDCVTSSEIIKLPTTFAFDFKAGPCVVEVDSPSAFKSNMVVTVGTRAPQTHSCAPPAPFRFDYPPTKQPGFERVVIESRFRSAKRIKVDFDF